MMLKIVPVADARAYSHLGHIHGAQGWRSVVSAESGAPTLPVSEQTTTFPSWCAVRL